MDSQNKYIIYDVNEALSLASSVEYLGTKEKGWITFELSKGLSRVLFKIGRPETGENWAEKVASHLAQLLDLPHASYDLGYLDSEKACVLSPSFLKQGEELRLGNQIIEGFDNSSKLKFKNIGHSITAIFEALEQNKVLLPPNFTNPIITHACEVLTGYLSFDAWIANGDRHAENWGIITTIDGKNILAPTFDHASSLGRNELDEKRKMRLSTKDKQYNVSHYVQNAKSPIYNNHGKKLDTIAVVKECKYRYPEATIYWIKKICTIMDELKEVQTIFDKVPDEFISDPAKEFALEMLKENAKRLRELLDD